MITKTINIIKITLLVVGIFIASCKKSKEDEPPKQGQVSIAELQSVQPPTFKTFIKAFETVTTAKPELLTDSISLGRAIFEWIKVNPNGRVINSDTGFQTSRVESFFDLLTRLTYDEWVLSIFNPVKSWYVYQTIGPSGQTAIVSFPCDSDVGYEDSKADALRHAYWNALMVRATNASFAEQVANAHESATTNIPAKRMDLHNNKIGRDLAALYPTATKEQLLELLLQHQFYFLTDPNGAYPPEANNALVYFVANRPYDGTMTGSLTNPDSGGPWNATFYFNQCANVLRGEFTIIRGAQLQKRRFNGTINTNNTITLTISAPYLFENPAGAPFCADMVMNLSGTVNTLTGNWTSTNCTLGGVISLAR